MIDNFFISSAVGLLTIFAVLLLLYAIGSAHVWYFKKPFFLGYDRIPDRMATGLMYVCFIVIFAFCVGFILFAGQEIMYQLNP